jgi:hypothetical protein
MQNLQQGTPAAQKIHHGGKSAASKISRILYSSNKREGCEEFQPGPYGGTPESLTLINTLFIICTVV